MTTETLGTISSIIGILMFAWGIYKGYKELSLYGLMKKLADNKSTKRNRRILESYSEESIPQYRDAVYNYVSQHYNVVA